MKGAAVLVLIVSVLACGPLQPRASTLPAVGRASPTPAQVVKFDPNRLAPGDCVAPAAADGMQVHSGTLGATVTLPSGWVEDTADEGNQGSEATFALLRGREPDAVSVSVYPFSLQMTAHQAVEKEISEPGAGNVTSTGDCIIAGAPASYFNSTLGVSLLPGYTQVLGGYSLYITRKTGLVRLLIDLPVANGISTPIPLTSAMTDVKRILGSWKWDAA